MKIVVPAALPRFFVAFRLAAAAALIVAVTVEIAANPLGLGYGLMIAQQTLHPDIMFAMLIWLGIVGWSVNALLLQMQRRLFGPAALVANRPRALFTQLSPPPVASRRPPPSRGR